MGYSKQSIAVSRIVRQQSKHWLCKWLAPDCLGVTLNMNRLGKNNKVALIWVPEHQCIEENERTEQLTRKGQQHLLWDQHPPVLMVRHKQELKEIIESKQAKQWCNLPGHRQAKEMLGYFNRNRSEVLIDYYLAWRTMKDANLDRKGRRLHVRFW